MPRTPWLILFLLVGVLFAYAVPVIRGQQSQAPPLTMQDQLAITAAYAQDLERSQKRCQLEKADIWAQALKFEQQLAQAREELALVKDAKRAPSN